MGKKEKSPAGYTDGEYSIDHALNIALTNQRNGNFQLAESLYTQLLSQVPTCQDALNYYGVLCHQMGRTDEGANLVRQAVTIDPSYTDAWNNLGNLLVHLGRHEEAEKVYRKVIRQDPEHVNALSNLGLVCRRLEQYEKSEKYYRRALALVPDHVEANRNLGNLLFHSGRREEALAFYGKAIENGPEDARSYRAFGRAYRLAGNVKAAIEIYRRWLAFEPDSATAKHHLAALTGEGVPDRASAKYVTEEFDGFADSFDRVLRRLQYRAPELCHRALEAELPEKDGTLSILDAGCGTGLCGEFLRPRAKVLTGVDLSQKMVERARTREEYDELVVADLLEWLPGSGPFDVVLSADTLCYFGDLGPVLAGMAGVTVPGGLVIFTVEAGPDDGPDYELQGHGRYRHSERSVRDILENVGLEVRRFDREILRTEAHDRVGGYVVTAVRPRSTAPSTD